LAALAQETVSGRSIAPSADPAAWWGLRPRTDNEIPVRPVDAPLHISASALGAILDCPMRWFLSREAAGESTRSSSLGFGSVIHALAEHMSTDDSVEASDLYALLDSVWDRLDFESPWIADRERAEAEKVIDRFLKWHAGRPDRAFVASEVPFSVEVDVGGGERAALSGRLDRVERDGDGRVVVVDFKTSRNAPPETSLGTNPQLGLYQLAVESGGLDDVCGAGARSGGAELVQLRLDVAGSPKVQVQPPQAPDDEGYKPVEIQLASAAQVMRSERFVAQANDHCRMCDFASLCPARRRSGTVV
jgi:RecB family exonuclease